MKSAAHHTREWRQRTRIERSLYTLTCLVELWVNESAVSPREGQFTVSQVSNDSFYLQSFKLGVIPVVKLGNYNDLSRIANDK